MHRPGYPLVRQVDDHRDQVGHEGRAGPALVAHLDRPVASQRVQEVLHHSGGVSGLQPTSPYHGGVRAGRQLAGQFGRPVDAQRARRVVLGVGLGRPSVEHEVGGDLDQVGSHRLGGLPKVAHRPAVDASGPVGVALATVDVGPRRTVHDHRRPVGPHGGVHGLPISHVEGRPVKAHDRLGARPPVGESGDHGSPKATTGAGHQNGHRASPSRGSHQS